MADHRDKPIEDVRVGDTVVATDPGTGETAARAVTALIRHGGKHRMVDVGLGDGSRITATDHHPFWVATVGRFVDAVDLHVGDQVRGSDGASLAVTAAGSYDADLTAYNLTVDDIHTYYAGATPVLVHNSCAGDGGGAALTRVGRWMSSAEHDAMSATGAVQEGAGGVTNVAYPADIGSYMRQAAPGTRYVEFDVPTSSLVQGGKEGWATIPGPNSIFSRLNSRQGLAPYEFPAASNIEWLASKLPPW